jgi:hypothetical protein
MRTDRPAADAPPVPELLDDHACDLSRIGDALWGLEELIHQAPAGGAGRERSDRAACAIAHLARAYADQAGGRVEGIVRRLREQER